jgi:hypothetical protein
MKRKITLLMAAILIASITYGGNGKEALRGGLVGAAFGALVSELDHAVDPGVAIPVFAGLGALAGYARARDEDRHNRASSWRGPYASYPRRATISAKKTRSRHPGVSLTSVPITLANGMKVNITLFNLNGHYVGPKGEHYDSRPTAEMLAERYAK